MNKFYMMGRLTKDPETRYGGQNNTAVSRFSLAVDKRYSKSDDDKTDFFNIVAFGKAGEFAEKYLHKGIKVLIEGEVHNNNYKNSQGDTVYGFNFQANTIEFCESKKQSAGQQDDYEDVPFDADELPFN